MLTFYAKFHPDGFKYPAEVKEGKDHDHLTCSAARHDEELFRAWLDAHPKPDGEGADAAA